MTIRIIVNLLLYPGYFGRGTFPETNGDFPLGWHIVLEAMLVSGSADEASLV